MEYLGHTIVKDWHDWWGWGVFSLSRSRCCSSLHEIIHPGKFLKFYLPKQAGHLPAMPSYDNLNCGSNFVGSASSGANSQALRYIWFHVDF